MAPRRIENPFVRETVVEDTLDCGLRVCIMPKPRFRKQFAILGTNYGSIDNTWRTAATPAPVTDPDGVAHFLEHKMFEKADGDMFAKFADTGASANANTSFTSTKYLFSCTDQFERNLEYLMNFVQEPWFTPQTVQREQGIIAEEIRMYYDQPGWMVFFNLLKAVYRNHPARIDIGGSVESIGRITDKTLYDCWGTFYHPENMGMFIAGSADPDAVLRQVRENYGRRNYKPMGRIDRFLPEEPYPVQQREVRHEMPVARPKVMIGFKERTPPAGGAPLLHNTVTTSMLLAILFGGSSRFFREHYQSGLIDEDTFGVEYMSERGFGVTVVGGDTDEPAAFVEAARRELREARGNRLIEDNLERHRKKSLGKTLNGYNYPEPCCMALADAHFNQYGVFDTVDLLQSLTAADLRRRLDEHFDLENDAVSMVLPAAS